MRLRIAEQVIIFVAFAVAVGVIAVLVVSYASYP